MIENNLDEITERITNVTPANWQIDISFDDMCVYIGRKEEKPMRKSDLIFFENAAKDIAKLIVEVKQLREVNNALKKQIIKQDVDKDLRFI